MARPRSAFRENRHHPLCISQDTLFAYREPAIACEKNIARDKFAREFHSRAATKTARSARAAAKIEYARIAALQDRS